MFDELDELELGELLQEKEDLLNELSFGADISRKIEIEDRIQEINNNINLIM